MLYYLIIGVFFAIHASFEKPLTREDKRDIVTSEAYHSLPHEARDTIDKISDGKFRIFGLVMTVLTWPIYLFFIIWGWFLRRSKK